MITMTIREIPDSALGTIVRRVGNKYLKHIEITHSGEAGPVEAKGTPTKSYGKPDDVLSLTGKSASKGSNREAILTTFEKLEVKHGIGNVTRKMFRDECKKKKQDAQIIYQLIREGYLKQLGA